MVTRNDQLIINRRARKKSDTSSQSGPQIKWVFLACFWILLTLSLIWPLIARVVNSMEPVTRTEAGGTNYLIIAPYALSKAANAWADYRFQAGYQVHVTTIPPEEMQVQQIREIVQKTYQEEGKPSPFYVLLLGHAHPDSSHPETYLPAGHQLIDLVQFGGPGIEAVASDDLFLMIGEPAEKLPVRIGRVPAVSNSQALQVLERVRNYETYPPAGLGRTQIEVIASDAGFGPQFDPIFEWSFRNMAEHLLPAQYQWHILYGNPGSLYSYPVSDFQEETAERLSQGSLMVAYIGHGEPDMLAWAVGESGDRERILGFDDIPLVTDASASLAVFTACSAGKYDGVGDRPSIVEALFMDEQGPVAAYSSSAWINGASNGQLVMDLFSILLIDQPLTVGDWIYDVESNPEKLFSNNNLIAWLILRSLSSFSNMNEGVKIASHEYTHELFALQHHSYNLFGDPATKIASPETGIDIRPSFPWLPAARKVNFQGTSELPAGTTVKVQLAIVPGRNTIREDGALDSSILYELANHSIVSETDAKTQIDGGFSGELVLPEGLTGGKYILKAVSIDGTKTIIGVRPVYLGWSSVVVLFLSTKVWWCLVSLLLIKHAFSESIPYKASTVWPALFISQT